MKHTTRPRLSRLCSAVTLALAGTYTGVSIAQPQPQTQEQLEEITVSGEFAYEWGTYRGSVRPRAGGEAMSYHGKLLRILQRQADGSWKMHRTMTTNDPD